MDEIKDLLQGESPRAIFNFKSTKFKNSGIDESTLSDDDLITMLHEEPRYFRRPLARINSRIIAGANSTKLAEELGFKVP